jgi:hypothetical protein
LLGRLANAARATGEDVDFVSLAAHDFSLGVASAFAVFWVVLAPCVMRGSCGIFRGVDTVRRDSLCLPFVR